jgi:hypothetical protein
MNNIGALAGSLLALGLLTSCSSAPDSEPGATAPPVAQPTSAGQDPASPSNQTPQATDRCLAVKPKLLELIASAAEPGVGKLTFSDGAAVRSEDFTEAYMIAARFSAPGVDNETGIWSSNSLEPGKGLMLSVDGFAKQFTIWPDADKTKAEIEQSTDGVEEARACLE